MPPQRRPLAEISGNRDRGQELMRTQRGEIIARRKMGESRSVIARDMDCAKSSINYTMQQTATRLRNNASKARSGRPRKLSEEDERRIIRTVRINPMITYAELRQQLGIEACARTIRRCLDRFGIRKWLAKKRPALTEEQARARLLFANDLADWDLDDFIRIVFSDECSVERGAGQGTPFVFRTSSQAYDRDMVVEYQSGKQIRIMIWGCFSGSLAPQIFVMNRDPLSPRNGYSSRSYMEALEPLANVWRPRLIFQQDNASIHRARVVDEWFQAHGIETKRWPAHSPNLNPIEHAWAQLKQLINEQHPELITETGRSEDAHEAFTVAIIQAWDSIDPSYWRALWQSMPDRVRAVREAEGWYTKY